MSDFRPSYNPEHIGTVPDYDSARVESDKVHFDADDAAAIAASVAAKIDGFEAAGDFIEPAMLVRLILPTMFIPNVGAKDDFMLSLFAGKPLGWQIALGRLVGYVTEAKREKGEYVIAGTGEVKELESIWLRGGFKGTMYLPDQAGKLRSFKSAHCILPKGAGELIEEVLVGRPPVPGVDDAPEFDVDIGLEKIKRGAVFYQWTAQSHFSTSMDRKLAAIEGRRRPTLEGRPTLHLPGQGRPATA